MFRIAKWIKLFQIQARMVPACQSDALFSGERSQLPIRMDSLPRSPKGFKTSPRPPELKYLFTTLGKPFVGMSCCHVQGYQVPLRVDPNY